jgi:hypothetical protein
MFAVIPPRKDPDDSSGKLGGSFMLLVRKTYSQYLLSAAFAYYALSLRECCYTHAPLTGQQQKCIFLHFFAFFFEASVKSLKYFNMTDAVTRLEIINPFLLVSQF